MKKFKFLTIKKKTIIAVLLCVFCVGVFCPTYFAIKSVATPKHIFTVVIDAGHGGIDNGCEGYSGTKESEINLAYATTLQQYCKEFGFSVVMTRNSDKGLYSPFASNKKKDDMKARKEIIEKSKADIVVSVHMNSYPKNSSRGAQVFYNQDNENSKILADKIQAQFVKNLVKPRKTSQKGDYFIVNCTPVPSVIVECGFISNKEEEQLLLTESYKDNVCYSILCGILTYIM